jgi:hypothetical protein
MRLVDLAKLGQDTDAKTRVVKVCLPACFYRRDLILC